MSEIVRQLSDFYIKIFDDLYMDFAYGFRIQCTSNNIYIIKVYDNYTNILHHTFVTKKNVTYYGTIKFFIRWRIQIYKNNNLVYQHILNLKDQQVIFEFSGGAIGDILANISAIDEFQKKHQCKMHVFMDSKELVDILKDQYDNLSFYSSKEIFNKKCYAHYVYSVGNIFAYDIAPFDYRIVGLMRTNAYLLHIDENKITKAKLNLSNPRKIQDKYVVISTQSSGTLKNWLKENWIQVVKYLKSLGYRVIQIGIDEQLIDGCENSIGNIHLQQRVDLIHYADMFIGLSSGLSWIAYCCNIPVVMICNATLPGHEFYTKYRVHPTTGCKGCFHALNPKSTKQCINHNFQECKKNITVQQLCNTINDVIEDNKK